MTLALFFRPDLFKSLDREVDDSGVRDISSRNFGFLLTTAGFAEVLLFGVVVVVCLRLEQPEAIPNKKRRVATKRKFIPNCLVFVGK